MATYCERKLKNGHINVAKQIFLQDINGKSCYKCTTYKNPENLTGKRLEKASHAFGEEWEKKMRNGNANELENATFNDIASLWLNVKKAKISKSYYVRAVEGIERLSKYLGNKKFVDIKAIDIQHIFSNFNNYEYTKIQVKANQKTIDKLSKIILDYGVRKAEKEKVISRPTLYYVRKGDFITIESAKTICNKFNLDFDEYFEKIETKQNYRNETIMHYKRILSAIFNYAIKIELVSKNYASSCYLKDIIGGEPAKDIAILSENEYDKFLNILNDYDLFQTIPLYLLATLGLRTCEVCGLKWEDIDFDNRIISIKRDRIYTGKEFGIVVNPTKTKNSTRDLYMCDLLETKLKEFKQLIDKLSYKDKHFNKEGFIFCNIDGSPAFPHSLNNLLKKYLEIADCELISCHKIRHSWITRLIGNGTPVNIVSKMAGHADTDVTLKIYTHYSKDIDNSKQVLENIFGTNLNKNLKKII